MIDISHIPARVQAVRDAFAADWGEPADEVLPRSILADIMHWCADTGIDFDNEMSIATDFFGDEREGQLTDDQLPPDRLEMQQKGAWR